MNGPDPLHTTSGNDHGRESLDQIALRTGTDKSSASHGYTRRYETYLEPIRDEPVTLLELGYGGHGDPAAGGASAATWRDYFPNGTVVVIDNEPKVNTVPGVEFHQGSQADPEFIDQLAAKYGPFDVIIDDASHLSSLTIRSWQLLYPHLKPGGLYVVEDTHMAYHDFYYGPAEANRDPDLPTSSGAPTAMQYLKRLADEVNCRDAGDWALFPARYSLGYRLDELTFFYNLAFIRKAAQ